MAKGKGGFLGHDGLNAPDAPTGVSGTAGDTQVDVSFTSPSDVGGSAITEYLVTDSTKTHTATGSSSPVTVTGLTNGTSYTFNVWAINAFGWSVASDASGSVTPVAPNYGDRGVIAGGYSTQASNRVNRIDYANITTTGDFADFGDLATTTDSTAGLSSGTRGVFGGGDEGSRTNRIQYITIASTGNTSDFGDLTLARERMAGVSSTTRGVFCGGTTGSNTNVMDYITIASTGNAADFGDTNVTQHGQAGASSLTRGLIIGGTAGNRDNIEYITIATTGNGTDFGDLTGEHELCAAYSNGTTAMIGNDNEGSSTKGRIESVTIATLGNATAFGSLTTSEKMNAGTMVANSTRALATVGFSDTTSTSSGTVEYFTIATTGNGTDFGDLTQNRHAAYDGAVSGS
jgi:hypothetical protein